MTAEEYRSNPGQHGVFGDRDGKHRDPQNTAAHDNVLKMSARPVHPAEERRRQQKCEDAYGHAHIHDDRRHDKNIHQIQDPGQCGDQSHDLQAAAAIPVRFPVIFQKNGIYRLFCHMNYPPRQSSCRLHPVPHHPQKCRCGAGPCVRKCGRNRVRSVAVHWLLLLFDGQNIDETCDFKYFHNDIVYVADGHFSLGIHELLRHENDTETGG